MRSIKLRLTAAAILVAAASTAVAQDSGALLELLVRKGIVTEQEAEDLRADLAKEASAATVSTAKGSFLEKVTLTGRTQVQYVGLSTDVDGTTNDPAANNHVFLRRVRLGVRAQMLNNFYGYVNYDFGGAFFDAAYLTWKASETAAFDVGLRKAPIGYEEFIVSSGSLKAIERSGITRYFMESNNTRRLGSGKYHNGVFFNGGNARQGFSYQFAVTNPEQAWTVSDAISTGSAITNHFAYWGHGAYTGNFDGGAYKFGASAGFLPDMGGKIPGQGNDLIVANAFGDVTFGKLNIAGEVYWSDNDQGAGAGLDSNSWGFYVQPSYRFGLYEIVARYGYVDSDGRGVNLSDSVRSAPSGGTMNLLSEGYLGGTWYMRGNDVKLQAGYVWGESKDTVLGAPAKATTQGVRSQFQVNF